MISVVVPVHDEERSVALLYDELQAALEPLGQPWEAVFVDDGSTDGIVRRAHAPARAQRQRPRRPPAPQLRQGGGARRRLRAGSRATSSSRSTATCRTTRPRSRGCSRSSTRASTSSPGWKTHRRDPLTPPHPLEDLQLRSRAGSPGLRLHDMNCGLKAYRAEVVRGLRLYGELHRFIPVLAHYRGYRVAELPVNHRPREHGRSRYGVERYLRGFLDLLTVSFMGRYRHRPLHLFGGLGLLLGAGRDRDPRLPDGRQDRPATRSASGRCSPRRPARRRRDPVLLARPDQRDDHEPPRGAGGRARAHASCTSTKCSPERVSRALRRSSADARPLLRHLRARLPAERAGDLVPAPGRASRSTSGTRGLGGSEHKLARGPGGGAAARRAEARGCSGADARLRRARRRLSRATSTCPQRGAPRAGGRSSSTRSSRLRTRSSATAARFRAGVACGAGARAPSTARRSAPPISSSPTRAPTPRISRSWPAAARAGRGLLRRRRGAGLPPGWSPRRAVHALFVGKLIPLHGLETILAAARLAPELRFRLVGSGQLEASLRERPPNVELRAVGRVRAPAGRAAPRRLRARDLRHLGEGARA